MQLFWHFQITLNRQQNCRRDRNSIKDDGLDGGLALPKLVWLASIKVSGKKQILARSPPAVEGDCPPYVPGLGTLA